MVEYYDLALIINSDMTLSQLKATFEKLESLNIYIDYNSLELNADFSYILAQYPANINIHALDKSIAKIDGIEIDYKVMVGNLMNCKKCKYAPAGGWNLLRPGVFTDLSHQCAKYPHYCPKVRHKRQSGAL